MIHAQQYLLAKLLEEVSPMFEDEHESMFSTFMRRLRNLRQQPAPVAPAAALPQSYRLPPVSRVSLRCPDCGKLMADSHFSVHQAFCRDWREWKRK